jgi:hypothetical protein
MTYYQLIKDVVFQDAELAEQPSDEDLPLKPSQLTDYQSRDVPRIEPCCQSRTLCHLALVYGGQCQSASFTI